MASRPHRLILGVDDAGRGAVIGPLVIAGVLLQECKIQALKSLGVKDSKTLPPRKRVLLAEEVKRVADGYMFIELSPAEVDEAIGFSKRLRRLNILEAEAMAKVIKKLKPHVAYIDAPDVLADRFASMVRLMLPLKVEVVSEHHADRKYPVVSAASIIGKVRRDEAIAKLREKYGDLGSGYPSDVKTIRFLEEWIRRYGTCPEIVRKTWATTKNLLKVCKQSPA